MTVGSGSETYCLSVQQAIQRFTDTASRSTKVGGQR